MPLLFLLPCAFLYLKKKKKRFHLSTSSSACTLPPPPPPLPVCFHSSRNMSAVDHHLSYFRPKCCCLNCLSGMGAAAAYCEFAVAACSPQPHFLLFPAYVCAAAPMPGLSLPFSSAQLLCCRPHACTVGAILKGPALALSTMLASHSRYLACAKKYRVLINCLCSACDSHPGKSSMALAPPTSADLPASGSPLPRPCLL